MSRLFPVLESSRKRLGSTFPKSIPWEIIAPHERQADINHGQTLERLAERGGLSWSELDAVLNDTRYKGRIFMLPREEDDLREHELKAAERVVTFIDRFNGIVVQRNGTDCGVCCLAMATGLPYEEVLSKLTPEIYNPNLALGEPGSGMGDVDDALECLGLSSEYKDGYQSGDFARWNRGFYISPEYFRLMVWGRRALMSVPSLNHEGRWHMVYTDGKRVLDPSPKKRYTRFDQLKPEWITVFQEGGQ
jgi:hypothetical protein